MENTAFDSYISLFTLTKQNLGWVLPLVIPVFGVVGLLAWRNPAAFRKLEKLALIAGCMTMLFVVVWNVMHLYVMLPYVENGIFELIAETDLSSARFGKGLLLERIQGGLFAVDVIVFWFLVCWLMLTVFWVARHLFIEEQEDTEQESE